MTDEVARPRRPGRTVLRASVIAIALLAAFVLLLHTPPVRNYALGYAIRALEGVGVRLQAQRLDYNLFTLRVRLRGVAVSAIGEAQPFFVADDVAALVSFGAFSGGVPIDEAVVSGGAVRIVRRADGSTNLPRSTGGGDGEPPAIPVARFVSERLAIDYSDDAADIAVRVPALTVTLASDGQLRLDEPAELRIGDTRTRIDRFDGAAAFDRRDLTLSGFTLVTEELGGRLDGRLAIMRREPALDLRVNADADLQRAAKWWNGAADSPSGTIHLEGTLRGPFAEPAADFHVTSDRVIVEALDLRGLSSRVRLDRAGLQLDDARLQVADGQVTAAGGIEWGGGTARLKGEWRDVDVAQVVDALSDVAILPSGRATGEIDASGPVDAIGSWQGTARTVLSRGAVGRGRIPAPGEARLTLANGRWTAEARHTVGADTPVDVSLAGRLRGSSIVDSTVNGTIHAPQTDVQSVLRLLVDAAIVPPIDVPVLGTLRAALTVDGTVGRPRAGILVEGDNATIAGQDVTNVRVEGELAGSSLRIDRFSVEQPPSGDELVKGHLEGAGGYDLDRQEYTVAGLQGSWWIRPTTEVPLAGLVSLEYSGSGSGRLATGKGRISSPGISWRDTSVGELSADVELAGDEARIQARAPLFDAVADATVQLASPYTATIRATSDSVDLQRALSGARLPIAVTGTTAVRVAAEGPLERWREGRASVNVDGLDARLDMLPVVLREPAAARYEGGRVFVDRLDALVGNTPLSVSGSLPLEDGSAVQQVGDALIAELTGDVGDLASAAALLDVVRTSTGSGTASGMGPVTLLARVTGSLTSPAVAADLEVGPAMLVVRSDIPAIEGLRARAHLENGLLELRELEGSYQGATVSARGQAPLALLTGGDIASASGEAVLQATARGVTAAVLEPFLDASTINQIVGSLDATVDVSAPALRLDAVRGEIVLDRLELSVADLPVTQRAPTRVVAADGFARIESWIWEGEGRSLTLAGQVRLSDRQAALFADGNLDARFLTPFVRDAGVSTAGQLATRLSITGDITKPTINGDVRLAGGEVRVREPRIIASDLTAVAILARDNVHLTSLSGTVNGGALSGAGQLTYAPAIESRFNATVTGMALDFPEGLRTELDSSLELTTASAAGSGGRLSGLVTVRRGSYREPLALVTGLLANLRRSSAAGARTGSSVLDDLALDVRVVTDEDLVIQNNVARAQIGADLRVINVASAPALSGRAEIREGGQLFLGRNRYTVQTGTIDFSNPTVIEPILGIEAGTNVSGVEITVNISGSPENLMTSLSSPSAPELGQADLTALLLTGRRLEDLSTQQAAVVGAQVLGNFAGDVLGIAGRAVGLDTLRVGGVDTTTLRDPAEVASEADPTSRVTFGKSFGSKVDVTLSQSLREGDAQTWIIDYAPVRRINLRLVSNDDDLRSYEFRHDVIFGAAPQPIRSGDVSARLEPPRVSAIRLTGDLGFPEAELRRELRLREGERFDFIDWQSDRDRLEDFYHGRQHLAARVQARREQLNDRVELTYELMAGPTTIVRVSGTQLSRPALTEIEAAWAQSVYDGFLIEEVEGIARRELARQSNLRATVTASLQDEGRTRVLQVDVMPGVRIERIEIRFDGPGDPLLSELNAAVGGPESAQQALTNPAEYERVVVNALLARGYVEATAGVLAPVFEGSLAIVPVTVKTGPQFHIGRVAVEGATGIPVDQLLADAAVMEGTVYRAEQIDDARIRLQARYRREGFTSVALEVRETPRAADALVDIAFVVVEGARQVVSEIDISGNRSVDEDVITRALRLKAGDNLRAADWLEARKRLFETGLFRRVDILIEPIDDSGPTAPVRLRVVLEEWPALRLRYGFQVSEQRPEEEVEGRRLEPGVSADLTRRTLFGRAITVGGAAQYTRIERVGRVFTSTPTFFNLPIQSSFVVERSREEQRANTLVTDKTTASWEQRSRRGRLSLSYGLRFERNRTYDTAPPPDTDFPFDITAHIGRFTTSITWDTRDDAGDTARGTFASGTFEQASNALGSDLLFVRSLSQAYHFRSWKGVVLASAARYGIVVPRGGQEVGPSQRFFSGGSRSVRGVPEDSLGGLDFIGLPIGGESLLIVNQEARFPLFKWLRGVAFVDAGNVFPKPGDVNLTELVGSTGVGLRLVTPFALFRIDYGRTIWNRPVQDTGRWTFGIGQAF